NLASRRRQDKKPDHPRQTQGEMEFSSPARPDSPHSRMTEPTCFPPAACNISCQDTSRFPCQNLGDKDPKSLPDGRSSTLTCHLPSAESVLFRPCWHRKQNKV